MTVKYMLLCSHCSNKVFTDGKDLNGLIVIPTAGVPKRADGKSPDVVKQKMRIKCNQCGRLMHATHLGGPEPAKPEGKDDPKADKF